MKLSLLQKLFDGEADVFGDLPQEWRCDVPTLMHWDCGAPAIGMPVLDMGAALTHYLEVQSLKQAADLGRLQAGD